PVTEGPGSWEYDPRSGALLQTYLRQVGLGVANGHPGESSTDNAGKRHSMFCDKNQALQTTGNALRPGTVAARAAVALSVIGLMTPLPLGAAPPQIPALQWEKRSDWVNVKTDVTPAAVGDGK